MNRFRSQPPRVTRENPRIVPSKSHAQQLTLRLHILRRLQCGGKMTGDDENHHLYQKKSGLWVLRFSIDQGPKFVAKRIKIATGTHCLVEARRLRDKLLLAYQRAGVTVRGHGGRVVR